MQTPREYLVSLGLAKPGRGRFSDAAKEALVKAISEGMVFKEPEVKAPASPRPEPKPVKEKPKGAADPKAVRAWAAENGITVAARGRVDATVINQYLSAMEQGGLTVAVPVNPADDLRPSRVVRPSVLFSVTELDGSVRTMTYRTACNECGYSFTGCLCTDPKVFSTQDSAVLLKATATGRQVPNDGKFW